MGFRLDFLNVAYYLVGTGIVQYNGLEKWEWSYLIQANSSAAYCYGYNVYNVTCKLSQCDL